MNWIEELHCLAGLRKRAPVAAKPPRPGTVKSGGNPWGTNWSAMPKRFTARDIAEILKVTPNNAHARLANAIKKGIIRPVAKEVSRYHRQATIYERVGP